MSRAPFQAVATMPAAAAASQPAAGAPAPAARPAASLHIGRLVFEGLSLPPAAEARFRQCLQQELTGLLADGLSPELCAGGALPRLPRALDARIGRPGDVVELAGAIARALRAGIGA